MATPDTPPAASAVSLSAVPPDDRVWPQLKSSVQGRDSVLHDRPFIFDRDANVTSHELLLRVRCFMLALSPLLIASIAVTIGLRAFAEANIAPILIRDLWGATGALLGITVTAVCARSELRAAVMLLLAAALATPFVVVIVVPPIAIPLTAALFRSDDLRLTGYLVVGLALGGAAGARAVIAYRRSPGVAVLEGWRSIAARIAIAGAIVLVAFQIIYWLSQQTPADHPADNAKMTAVLAAIAVAILYSYIAPPVRGTRIGPDLRRLIPRVLPIVIGGYLAEWSITRSAILPPWVDGVLTACLAGLMLGYTLDILERPFAGRRRLTLAIDLAVIVVLPLVRLIMFERVSRSGIFLAQLAALFGFVPGAVLARLVVGKPAHDVGEPDHPRLELARHVVLVMSSSPRTMPQLDVYAEAREIRQTLATSPHGQAFEVQIRPATRLVDLEQALREFQPSVVHLCGHGNGDFFYFHAADDLPDDVHVSVLGNLFRRLGGSVRVAVINACNSEPLGRALSQSVPFVVHTLESIDDRTAITFSTAFYRALGAGDTAHQACINGTEALRALRLPDHAITSVPGQPGDFVLVPLGAPAQEPRP